MKNITKKLSFNFLCFFVFFSIQAQKPEFIMDMVHHNPGEALTKSAFTNPEYVKNQGFNVQVMNDFIFPTAAVTFEKFDNTLFAKGTKERAWSDSITVLIQKNIKAAHAAGIKVFYFTDIVLLPKKLVEKYKSQVCDANGKITFEKPLTVELHKMMFDELFQKFPDLDGLVIRTGETYLNNVPYHTGNNPISDGAASHIKLLQLLRDEVCVKHNKTVIYRTWSIGGFHNDPVYYLNVSDKIEPNKNLIFSIKHIQGDYQRTYPFNPCIGIGKHRQVIEVQCQREYEGKGAYPNYVMNGVINGFEEYKGSNHPNCLNDIKKNATFAGIYSWSRGGGWVGPYISNEFWPRLNAFVLSAWANNPTLTEAAAFDRFMDEQGIVSAKSREAFRKLSLLSAKAVLRGHASAELTIKPDWVFWMRDHFLAGIEKLDTMEAKKFPSEGFLYDEFSEFYKAGTLKKAVAEKQESAKMWDSIVTLSQLVKSKYPNDDAYIRVSSLYGLYLHRIIAAGWQTMALGFEGDKTGKYDKIAIRQAIKAYDKAWIDFQNLRKNEPSCATLYKPNAFIYVGPTYYAKKGMGYSIDKYRKL
ncbi:MAG: hypothetical protein WCG93_16005 [Paludibacter sp.]